MKLNTPTKTPSEIIGKFITPSWTSLVSVIVVSVALVAGVIIVMHYPSSSLNSLIVEKDNRTITSVNNSYDYIDTRISDNSFVSDMPLYVLWGCVGLVAYTVAMYVYRMVSAANEYHEEMEHYANVNRHDLHRTMQTKIATRILAAVAWVLFSQLTIHVILPYVVAASQYASANIGLVNSLEFGGLAFIVSALTLHFHIVILRVLALKPHLIGRSTFQ